MVMSNEIGITLIWVFALLATVFVVLRIYVRLYLQSQFSSADAFILTGWFIFLFVQCANTANYAMGQWSTIIGPDTFPELLHHYSRQELKTIMILLWLAGPMSYTALWCIKAAFLIFYYQLMGRHRKLRWALHVTVFLVGTGWIVSQYLSLFSCIPVRRNWTMDSTFCNSYSVPSAYWFSIAIHLFTDLIIYSLPFFLLPSLHLSHRKKLGVVGMFLLGTFSIGTSVARVTICGIPPFHQAPVDALSAMECSTALMVACCPPLKWLYMSLKYCPDATAHQDTSDEERGMRLHSATTKIGGGLLTFSIGHGIRHVKSVEELQDMRNINEARNGNTGTQRYSSDGTTLNTLGISTSKETESTRNPDMTIPKLAFLGT